MIDFKNPSLPAFVWALITTMLIAGFFMWLAYLLS